MRHFIHPGSQYVNNVMRGCLRASNPPSEGKKDSVPMPATAHHCPRLVPSNQVHRSRSHSPPSLHCTIHAVSSTGACSLSFTTRKPTVALVVSDVDQPLPMSCKLTHHAPFWLNVSSPFSAIFSVDYRPVSTFWKIRLERMTYVVLEVDFVPQLLFGVSVIAHEVI